MNMICTGCQTFSPVTIAIQPTRVQVTCTRNVYHTSWHVNNCDCNLCNEVINNPRVRAIQAHMSGKMFVMPCVACPSMWHEPDEMGKYLRCQRCGRRERARYLL